jgi:tRNA pseudouridine13 synthase
MPFDYNRDFPRAWGAAPITALLKVVPEDFYVEEQLGFEPTGSGEHLYLFVEKRNQNTQAVAEHIARMAKVRPGDVSYSGLKDRRAVTRQWFSVYLPKGENVSWQTPPDCEITLLLSARHHKKLRRGEHAANFFRIVLSQIEGDEEALNTRLAFVAEHGVPNYYGEQRFGYQVANLQDLEGFLRKAKGKQQGFQDRLKVSAMRSWLFNRALALRVRRQCWQQLVDGDPVFYPSAPLWGRGRLSSSLQLREWEESIMNDAITWCHFLEHCGLQQERRPCVLKPEQFRHRLSENNLTLEFLLPPGTYATSLIREIADVGNSRTIE